MAKKVGVHFIDSELSPFWDSSFFCFSFNFYCSNLNQEKENKVIKSNNKIRVPRGNFSTVNSRDKNIFLLMNAI